MSDVDFTELTIADLLRRWPWAARVFIDYKMKCPGCLLAPFMTIYDAAREYGVDVETLKQDVAAACVPRKERW